MKKLIAFALLLPCLAFGQGYFIDGTEPYMPDWDGACTNGTLDTTFTVTGAANDTSCEFMFYPDMSMQVYLATADADSFAKVVVKLIVASVNTFSAYADSACGNKATIAQSLIAYDSGFMTATGWQYIRDISTVCPVGWAKIVVDGQTTNGNNTATTGSVRIRRFKNP